MNSFTSWSFSRLSLYEKCPAEAKYKHLDKLPEPQHPAMARGNEIHEAAAAYLVAPKPTKLALKSIFGQGEIAQEAQVLAKRKPIVEQQWAFNSDWQPTGWFAKDAWFRQICDVIAVDPPHARIIDHKTGKVYDSNKAQLELFAVGAFAKYSDVKMISTELWYLDQDKIIVKGYSRKEYLPLRKDWEKRANRMLTAKTFPPKPGNHCRWCNFSKSKGGPCKY